MKELINLAQGFAQQFECALVYGIANVDQLDNLFKVNAKQFVIIEADPSVFSKLEEWHLALPESALKVSCFHAALSCEDAPTALLYQSSQPGFSSTAKPNQIKRFRPGLTFSSVSVPAKKLGYFTDKYAIAANQQNIALLNCNGAEHEILGDSTSQLFSNIVVRNCSKALFGVNTQLPAALTDIGYSQVTIKSAQPHISLAALCRPLLVLEQVSLLEKARHEAEQYKQQVSDLVAQNETLTEQRDNQREHHLKNKEWAEQLKSQKQALETQLEQSESQLKQVSGSLESVNAELKAAQAREKNLQEKLEAEAARLEKLIEDNEGLTSKVTTLNSEHAVALVELQYTQSNLQGLADKLEKVNRALSAAEEGKKDTLEQIKVLKEKSTQLESTLATAQQERDNHKEHHLNNKKWAEGLNEANKAIMVKLEQLEHDYKKLKEENEALKRQLDNAEKREDQLTSTLTLNTKLLAKMRLDSEDLRSQFKEKAQSESELQELVKDLHQKLQQAAAFYHRLERQYPELLEESSAQ
jgi:chromosome segregation ATPase